MAQDLVTSLLPTLTQPWREEFNVLNVMHHGRHEKQISNIFTWLLDTEGSHNLGDRFLRIFVAELNTQLGGPRIAPEAFAVSQERNTSPHGEPKDVSDIVLEGERSVVVIENYFKSDGHHHSYEGYLAFADERGGPGKESVVAILCAYRDDEALAEDRNTGWRNAPVVTYSSVLSALNDLVTSDGSYRTANPQASWFVNQLFSYFAKGTPVNEDLLRFIAGMCQVGEAGRYGPGNAADADRFATDFSELARQRFIDSRELLMDVKAELRRYAAGTLVNQIEAATNRRPFSQVTANFQGKYQWTVNLLPGESAADEGIADAVASSGTVVDGLPGRLQLKFGPSAWWANSSDEGHTMFPKYVPAELADYTRLFLTWNGEIRMSSVTMEEVLTGLSEGDTRLRDEALELMQALY